MILCRVGALDPNNGINDNQDTNPLIHQERFLDILDIYITLSFILLYLTIPSTNPTKKTNKSFFPTFHKDDS